MVLSSKIIHSSAWGARVYSFTDVRVETAFAQRAASADMKGRERSFFCLHHLIVSWAGLRKISWLRGYHIGEKWKRLRRIHRFLLWDEGIFWRNSLETSVTADDNVTEYEELYVHIPVYKQLQAARRNLLKSALVWNGYGSYNPSCSSCSCCITPAQNLLSLL